jgi:vanillate O-demethylase monooxygenase subunit
MHWFAPALLYFDLGLTERTPEAKDFALPGGHFITPETELTSHYFFFQGRNVRMDSEEVDKDTIDGLMYAFGQQDKPLLEAQQQMLGPTSDLMSGNPILLETDAAPLAARRLLDQLIRQEQAELARANSREMAAV